MKKLAIFTPEVLPVPAVRGGAVEQLITYLIEGNELNHIYDIDLYTVDDSLLDNISYKYTNLIKIKKEKRFSLPHIVFAIFNRLLRKFGDRRHIEYINLKFMKAFKRDYYDSVLVENNMELYNLLVKKKTNERFYFHLHNDFDNGDVDKTYTNTKEIIQTADKIFVVSNFLKDKLLKLGARNVEVVYNAIDNSNLRNFDLYEIISVKKKLGIKNNQYVFTYIGRLDQKKGIDKFLAAFTKLDTTESGHYKCLVVGAAWNNPKFQRKLHKIEVSNKNIINIGYVPHNMIKEIFLVSDCIVIPTQIEEAFGEVALEAMMMKKPIICSDSGALPEITSQNGTFIVKRGVDFEKKLAAAMYQLATNRTLSINMGKANFEKSKKYPMTASDYFYFFKDL